MLLGHGDDTYRYPDIRINFSSNIYNHFDHTALFQHLYDRMTDLCTYPEPTPITLEQRLATHHAIPANCVMATNGATEAIYLIAQTFRDAHSIIPQPTFSEYADACRVHAHDVELKVSSIDLKADTNMSRIQLPPSKGGRGESLLWLCNPNNPTGTVIPKHHLAAMIQQHPDTLFVLDASYAAYTCEALLSAAEGIAYPNLLMLHSMTKDYGIPGLRLGYITASPELLATIMPHRMPWSVSQMAINAALYLLDHHSDYLIDAPAINRERQRVAEALTQTGIIVHPSQSNMLLCRHPRLTAPALKDHLATRHGILIRDASNFPSLTPHHFRIAVQSPEENDNLINIMHNASLGFAAFTKASAD